MHILITGGTGLIGRALCRYWTDQGHQLTVWSRRPQQVKTLCGAAVRGIVRLDELNGQALDAVVNLAGAPIADRPWTAKRKALLWGSRITLTEQLVSWMAAQPSPPPLLISASAVGFYGDSGECELSEHSGTRHEDFASQLCAAWEAAALQAAPATRVVLVRTGLVLAAEGGFLSRLLLPFKLGLGGRLGDGRQWMPWIHLADQIALIDFLLRHPGAQGPYNACAPAPVRNRDFTRCLGKALGRPAVIPVPALPLKLVLGDMAGLLLGGQRALPVRLHEAGFTFAFTDLPSALADVVHSKR